MSDDKHAVERKNALQKHYEEIEKEQERARTEAIERYQARCSSRNEAVSN